MANILRYVGIRKEMKGTSLLVIRESRRGFVLFDSSLHPVHSARIGGSLCILKTAADVPYSRFQVGGLDRGNDWAAWQIFTLVRA